MDKTEILTLAKNFFETEYNDLNKYFERMKYSNDTSYPRTRAVTCSLQRCLGIALFVQKLGVTYEEISPVYGEIQEKLLALSNEDVL